MAITTNNFSYFYNKIATICQDQSANGLSQAKDAVNTVIKKLTAEFKFPQMFKGFDQSIYINLSSLSLPQDGVMTLTLSQTDIVRLSDVFWVDNNQGIQRLQEVPGDQDWNDTVDDNSNGDPAIFRSFQPSNAGTTKLQLWPGINQGWVNKTDGNLFYTYWAQLSQLVNDSDIPNLPYELDYVLTSGGVIEMARQQGDNVLMALYKDDYEMDKGNIRAWIIKQRTQDGQMQPDQQEGAFGRAVGITGYGVPGYTVDQ